METIIESARTRFDSLVLTEEYRNKQFSKNFDKHLTDLIDTAVNLSSKPNVLTTDKAIISDKIYWESESLILEKLDKVRNPSILDELDNLEDHIYSKIKNDLGVNYDVRDERLNMIIDNSVHNYMLSVKFNFFDQKDLFVNPWSSASDIIIDNQVLFTFSKNAEKLKSMGFNIKRDKESELIADQKINIVAKGNRKDYAYHYVRDLIGLRNTVLDIMEHDQSYGERAMKIGDIIAKIRALGIPREELSDSNIKSWIVFPLKQSGKIGSHKEGYFLLKDCIAISISYKSHFVNLKGYYRTLQNHKRLASKFGCTDYNFDEHNSFLLDSDNKPSD